MTDIKCIARTNRLPLLRVIIRASSGQTSLIRPIQTRRLLLLLKLLPRIAGQPDLIVIQLDIAEWRPIRSVGRRDIGRHLLRAEITNFLGRVAVLWLVYYWRFVHKEIRE